jgi:glycosyltransferase involved in cell wall biosynthesis
MARCRPLLVSSASSFVELVAGGRGRTCGPGDVSDLAWLIQLLMKDDALYGQVGAAALAFARDELTPQRRRARLAQAYAKTLANGAY